MFADQDIEDALQQGGEALEEVARIHPALARLRALVTSATLLDLKATANGYWAGRPAEEPEVEPPPITEQGA